MARLPQARAVLRLGGPFERPTAVLGGDFIEALRLFGDASRRAVELDEQHRRLGQRELGINIRRFNLQFIEQFDTRDRNPRLDRHDGGVAGGLDRGEWAMAAGDRLGNAVELERERGGPAERAFRADEQAREGVTGRGFLGAAAGGYD